MRLTREQLFVLLEVAEEEGIGGVTLKSQDADGTVVVSPTPYSAAFRVSADGTLVGYIGREAF